MLENNPDHFSTDHKHQGKYQSPIGGLHEDYSQNFPNHRLPDAVCGYARLSRHGKSSGYTQDSVQVIVQAGDSALAAPYRRLERLCDCLVPFH